MNKLETLGFIVSIAVSLYLFKEVKDLKSSFSKVRYSSEFIQISSDAMLKLRSKISFDFESSSNALEGF